MWEISKVSYLPFFDLWSNRRLCPLFGFSKYSNVWKIGFSTQIKLEKSRKFKSYLWSFYRRAEDVIQFAWWQRDAWSDKYNEFAGRVREESNDRGRSTRLWPTSFKGWHARWRSYDNWLCSADYSAFSQRYLILKESGSVSPGIGIRQWLCGIPTGSVVLRSLENELTVRKPV